MVSQIYISLIWKCKCFSYGKKHILNAKDWDYFDKDEWELKINSLRGCKDGGRVGSYGVDGTAVGLDFSQLVTVLDVPQLEEAPSTTTKQYVVWWHELQSTDPVLVGRIYRLQIDSQNAHFKYMYMYNLAEWCEQFINFNHCYGNSWQILY